MHKPANNDFPILHQLRERWSPRALSSRPVPPESVRSLLEAARWAPSAYNTQPWRFIIAVREQSEAEFESALACINEYNRGWATAAPILLFAVAETHFENRSVNRHAFHDSGQAIAGLTVQATALGLYVHQMAGILIDEIRQTYSLPAGFEPVCGAAIGYLGEADNLADDLKQKELAPRARRPLSETVFSASWGQSAAL
ncbi:MAG: nitroreductase family protein [Rhodospirillaceae bacterium]|nr:nitroreductase family protein [Rhodospirillaceae bacterium]